MLQEIDTDTPPERFFPLQKGMDALPIAAPPEMVVVAQLVEPRIVIPVVAGSSPVDHPIFPIGYSCEVRKGGTETKPILPDAAARKSDSLQIS